jgi:hypothetical protein
VGRCGKVPEDIFDDINAALETLSNKIADVTGKSKELASKVIKDFYMGGNIEIRNGKTEPTWGWTPNPRESSLKKTPDKLA